MSFGKGFLLSYVIGYLGGFLGFAIVDFYGIATIDLGQGVGLGDAATRISAMVFAMTFSLIIMRLEDYRKTDSEPGTATLGFGAGTFVGVIVITLHMLLLLLIDFLKWLF